MKDIILKANLLKRELAILAICFIAAFLLNVYSIIKYNTNWIELATCLHIVIILSFLIYVILAVVRLAVLCIIRATKIFLHKTTY